MLYELFTNTIVWSVLFSVSAAQSIKWFLHYRRTGDWEWRWLFRDAGMPSAHTATVTALTFSLILEQGITSLTIAVGVLSAIVMRDVIGDKIFAEKQEHVINNIIEKIQDFIQGERVEWKHFTGHTILEVIAGFIVGIVMTSLIHYNF